MERTYRDIAEAHGMKEAMDHMMPQLDDMFPRIEAHLLSESPDTQTATNLAAEIALWENSSKAMLGGIYDRYVAPLSHAERLQLQEENPHEKKDFCEELTEYNLTEAFTAYRESRHPSIGDAGVVKLFYGFRDLQTAGREIQTEGVASFADRFQASRNHGGGRGGPGGL